MNKNQLAQELAVSERLPLSTAYKAIDGLVRITTAALRKGDPVKIRGFGGLYPDKRAPYVGKNPHTGEPIDVPEQTVVRFRAGDTLHQALNFNENPESWTI